MDDVPGVSLLQAAATAATAAVHFDARQSHNSPKIKMLNWDKS